jgi:hypothetical protein
MIAWIDVEGVRLAPRDGVAIIGKPSISIRPRDIESPFLAEGRLRGTAARLIVTIENGHRGRTSLSADDWVATGEGED